MMHISAVAAINPKTRVHTKGEFAQAYRRAKKDEHARFSQSSDGVGYFVDPVALRELREYQRQMEHRPAAPRRGPRHWVFWLLGFFFRSLRSPQ